ncbi:Eaa1 [Klebsiella pneumoniae]|nr:DUF551 domain-containing protein [Klebsiella pneumoniae]SWF05494.1 Eaa1 [Klebsiella pneumoniae]
MTKSTITIERLEKIKSWRETYGAGSNVMLPAEEAEALALIALAAMDSESWCLPLDYLQGHKDGLEWASQLAEANHPETGDWFYDDPIELAKAIRKGPDMPPAQPAPVVDADDNFYSWFGREWAENYQHNQYSTAAKQMLGVMAESAWKAGRRAAMLQSGNSPVVPDERAAFNAWNNDVDCPLAGRDAKSAAWLAWQSRAAMLAAAPQLPGSDPATVPGKWIQVSEQMPEVGDIVLTAMGGVVNVGETECSAANCRFFTSVISGRELPATHWMPLPAAPQEVNHG